VKPTQKWRCGGNIVKKCINCGQIEKDRKRYSFPLHSFGIVGTDKIDLILK